ncbi:uncharacterized protein JCM6883_000468 [Sporobolomyces salmoneus]|uniref:uncharacterized protein n=1 Tax=Sporobolomyces salmoneus TaxID=183962 RepID=UPI00317041D1
MNWPHSPVQPFLWNPSPTATPLTNDSPQQTPFHSAVSSPLSIYFAFPPELEHQSTKEEPKVDVFAHYPPLELQIRVMKALLEVCEEDWRREVREGSWKGAKARERWSEGEARGRRELARVGRVSRSWKKLSLDSQLWANGPATASIGADALDVKSIVSLFDQSGPAIQRLDLQGFGKSLTSKLLRQITEGASTDGCTNLTSINLRGCNSLSSRSITNLLISSPHLVDIDLFALYQVRSSHLEILASRCEHLESLNVSRCRNLPASSLLVLCDNPPPRRRLKSLFISALPGMTNDILVELWTNLPALSSLDISFSPHLTDDAFKRLTTDHAYPSLRSLNLAGCTSLTSLSLSYFVVNRTIPSTSLLPSLEQLELSRLSPSFDAGDHLSSFLESVRPTLKKLDLEDGINLTDSVLQSLKGSNSRLETLLLNSCSRFTDEAILEVVRECKRLKVLEVDGTEVSDSTAKEFVRLVSERQERGNQEGTEEKGGGRPKVLSILDNRLTGRRLHREIGTSSIRPRIGYRGWWTGDAVGFYHDGNEENTVDGEESEEPWKKRLEECDEERIVVRSFYSSLEVDAANAARRAREENRVKAKDSKGGGLLRIRAMSDSVLSANSARVGGGENGHEGEGDGNSSTATGCLVM